MQTSQRKMFAFSAFLHCVLSVCDVAFVFESPRLLINEYKLTPHKCSCGICLDNDPLPSAALVQLHLDFVCVCP